METNERIDFALLANRDFGGQVLLFEDIVLFEDELHDHGISRLNVRIVLVSFPI